MPILEDTYLLINEQSESGSKPNSRQRSDVPGLWAKNRIFHGGDLKKRREREPPELSLSGRNTIAYTVTSRPYSRKAWTHFRAAAELATSSLYGTSSHQESGDYWCGCVHDSVLPNPTTRMCVVFVYQVLSSRCQDTPSHSLLFQVESLEIEITPAQSWQSY
ncbi:hypothetical protein EVAR_82456_1 [Eumeta japonica]|uniref:Uncharacterized protein n=1 Tax=Eumeta variegata TaxID=151549 RepID=A0A4C1X7Z7_EUMVA|nr:hypothetical protein EVAR_82456_1 [Eumeta japonica]